MINSVTQLLYSTVQNYPDKPCIKDEKNALCFKDFFSLSFELAEILFHKKITNCPILIYLPKNIHAIVAFAATLISGNFYVPIDVNSPLARQKQIINDIQPYRIFTIRKYEEKLRELHIDKSKILYLDEVFPNNKSDSIDMLIAKSKIFTSSIIDTDPCYVMYTSGSTGIPKGVVIPHRGVLDYITWAISALNVNENEIIGNQSPLFFDNSTLDIYLSWATGAELILIPEKVFIFPVKLIEFLEENNISFIFFIPSVLISISKLRLFNPGRLPRLKKIIFAGEVMPSKHLAYWQENLVDRMYANLYGPTEITVDCTYFIINRVYSEDERLPIGYPCQNSGIIVLNDKDEATAVEELGELCVRGSSLALGYWNDKEKTDRLFVQNPLQKKYRDLIYRTGDLVYKNEQNQIIFVGRKDAQIKHLGYRIELGEIEAAAMSNLDITNCCALYHYKTQEITLFYEGEKEFSLRQLRKSLGQKLPQYMLPRKAYFLHNIPLNPTGKIDRKALANDYFLPDE